jgi:hypothetical protein
MWPSLSGTISMTVGSFTSFGSPVQNTVFTLSRVRRRDAVYNEPAMAATMLASAAPITVPAALSWEPKAAAVIAASAPPTICVTENSKWLFLDLSSPC